MQLRRQWLVMTVLMLALCPLLAAADVTYTISGTLGPILSGDDPLGANGESGVLTAVVSESLSPTSSTSSSATYTLPAGSITVVIGGTTYGTTGTSTLKYTISSTGDDTMTITATVSVSLIKGAADDGKGTVDDLKGTVVGTAYLAKGSFPKGILKHPTTFTPTTQTLTPASTAGGTGSQVSYSAAIIGTTVLGLSGTATD